MINTNKKGYLIMINKYTFSRVNKESSIWVCSRKRSHECKAKVKMEESGSITPYSLEHNHEPPSYHITSDGTYVKVMMVSGRKVIQVFYIFSNLYLQIGPWAKIYTTNL
ncbi:hypothetical protein ABMA28_001418 [Loxostege sticticalis]|uniref:FLYWCH-type domain-containing protein n=1 Tax=Loxostege sticticalis TaxID=481309 RepID=A0ABD0T1K6_LOXSC